MKHVLVYGSVGSRFYYDFYNQEKQITDADLKLIKKEMDKIIKCNLPLVREEVTRFVTSPHLSACSPMEQLDT